MAVAVAAMAAAEGEAAVSIDYRETTRPRNYLDDWRQRLPLPIKALLLLFAVTATRGGRVSARALIPSPHRGDTYGGGLFQAELCGGRRVAQYKQ